MVISSDTFVRFREGEETAFRQLYDDYSPRITYFAGKILKDDPYTEDIVSDIFRKAWENRRKFAGQRRNLEEMLASGATDLDKLRRLAEADAYIRRRTIESLANDLAQMRADAKALKRW